MAQKLSGPMLAEQPEASFRSVRGSIAVAVGLSMLRGAKLDTADTRRIGRHLAWQGVSLSVQ